MKLPCPRGPLSKAVLDRLRTGAPLPESVRLPDDLLSDHDFQLALWVLYELHYRGFAEIGAGGMDDPEWAPDVLAFRGLLEHAFEGELRALVARRPHAGSGGDDVVDEIRAICEADDDGPSMAAYVRRSATLEQFTEFMAQRSIYHLKESDPQSWVIPRLGPAVKAPLVELQYDEYGGGVPERVHQNLFAAALEALDLDPAYGAYIDRTPGHTLAENNAMSLFGLHRRLRGASLGHLAAFETTSSVPCRYYAMGVRRLELPEPVAAYFDEHVEADSVHEQLALRDICGRLVEEDAHLAADVLLGAAVCMELSRLTTEALLAAWEHGSALLPDPMGEAA